ncbi:hypothetical protein K1719_028048 [Acacia pycnantha]|nr:hypothetical protein K1719_028048 [Acacia pycnantha]
MPGSLRDEPRFVVEFQNDVILERDSLPKTQVWVQVWGLPIDYHTQSTAKLIGDFADFEEEEEALENICFLRVKLSRNVTELHRLQQDIHEQQFPATDNREDSAPTSTNSIPSDRKSLSADTATRVPVNEVPCHDSNQENLGTQHAQVADNELGHVAPLNVFFSGYNQASDTELNYGNPNHFHLVQQ